MMSGLALGQRALDRIAGDHRVVHQQAEGDDQGGDGNLLDIDAEQVHHAEGHCQGDGDGDGHQHRGAPLPKAEPRHQHHQHDRLVERIHEQAEVLFHLQRLVGGAGDDQVLGKILLHRRELGVDAAAEGVDLLAILHLHRHASRRGCGASGRVCRPRSGSSNTSPGFGSRGKCPPGRADRRGSAPPMRKSR